MSTIFQRTTVRAATRFTGMFIPQTSTRIFAGANEMSVVVVGKLLSITPVAAIDVFIAREGPITVPVPPPVLPATTLGWDFSYDPSYPEAYLTMTKANGQQVYGESRFFTAADLNKVHRLVGVGSVAAGTISCYTNGRIGTGLIGALPSFIPSPAPDVYGVLGVQIGGGPTAGMRAWEVCDIAVIDRAFTAREVTDLDELILATGRVPAAFAQWSELYTAERLQGHKLVWDAGGKSAGRGWPAFDVAPQLGSVLIEPGTWGGSGT